MQKRKLNAYRSPSGMTCIKSRFWHSVKQLQKGFLYLFNWKARDCNSIKKAEDVKHLKGGHFSVLTIGNGEPKKFSIALSYLTYRPFVKLLEAAEQEFGFNQPGVLVIPCEASELQRILS